jgi:hypothetical protein
LPDQGRGREFAPVEAIGENAADERQHERRAEQGEGQLTDIGL